ncbi:MAG: acetyl-CoA carboxylase biotin carboxyl carrier protein [Clostridium argentinense]|uniref:Biotin carboxyl carrier protein of acetyl-CoA carboxylase n=1 Tax=Clostridium faecium TaxID=2762223 RepID=A0ABR8YSL8_9CLOT|nr:MULTISPECIES: acetyl-CoA carboxylase biotin carboxyl carrier protein [Clostridium]MBD8047248.1 acetyl-CoA carboxylase biotin carboxyl carrier protein [Clostridium faecium]MBS5824372.1 acetyl-CoA carboxylase biotin carboxyl carrier protein [Clostridium argentinense]MDU1349232.1 acetyl-CoA carboxylase biotin carboxyl carrier protein [Clostridium argentinense]
MDFKSIEQLIKAVSDSNLTSFEVEQEGLKIKMKKETETVTVSEKNSPSVMYETSVDTQLSTENNNKTIEKTSERVEAEAYCNEDLCTINSPIVGTFYSSPSPDSKTFVEVGSKVKKGDILCIIEAMKLMNEIESDVDGTITEVLAKNEDMVEYGQCLFKIKKD